MSAIWHGPKVALALLLGMAPAAAWTQLAEALPMTWRIERATSAMAERSCSLASWDGQVVARLEQADGDWAWSVIVGPDSQPGSLRYLRIERKIFTSQEARFAGAEAADIVARLKRPGVIAFEWARRPDWAKRQGLFGTGDFAAKAATCEAWVQGSPV